MKTLLAFAAASAAFGAAPAPARDSAPVPQSEVVRYADLNLATEAGRSALDRRISLAVREVCGSASDVDVHGKNLVRRCRMETSRAVSAQREAALAADSAASVRLASGQ